MGSAGIGLSGPGEHYSTSLSELRPLLDVLESVLLVVPES